MSCIRTRTGCFTCRRRKKKCDETKPVCRGCERNGLRCVWPVDLHIATSTSAAQSGHPRNIISRAASQDISSSAADTLCASCIKNRATQEGERSSVPAPASLHSTGPEPTLGGSSQSSNDSEDRSTFPQVIDDGFYARSTPVEQPTNVVTTDATTGIARATQAHGLEDISVTEHGTSSGGPSTMGFTLCHGRESFELLNFYLSRTVNSMGNGSTDINPFVAILVPLAFSSPLVLQLILAQSATHRHASQENDTTSEIALRCYHSSLRQFRELVDEYVQGKESHTLVLAVGSLILALTEVAKGDINGSTFDHLIGAKALLSKLLVDTHPDLVQELRNFLVEYYTHMSSLSMIALDPSYAAHSLLDPDITQLANILVQQEYNGQLCGCWLDILLLIPRIFELGRKIRATDESRLVPSPDDIIQFGLLQAQVMAFVPIADAHEDSALAGLVFKQAALLYLWTILKSPHQRCGNAFGTFIEGAVMEALTLLGQLSVTSRVNTSLCWPIAVIGNCVFRTIDRQTIRTRLETMHRHIGLGNMKETLVLLEHVWEQPLEDISPWTLYKHMQEHQIWISFA